MNLIDNVNTDFSDSSSLILCILLQISGTIILILGILNLFDGFIVFFVSLSMWTISTFYKGVYNWIIMIGLVLSGLILIFALALSYIDGFLGFFTVLYLYFLTGINYLNNKEELSIKSIKEF